MHPATAAAVLQAALDPAMESAVRDYLARKNRTAHPDGEFDKRGRWYPDAHEQRECCSGISQPTASYPYPLMIHCRTVEHVATLHGVDVSSLRRASLAIAKAKSKTADGGGK